MDSHDSHNPIYDVNQHHPTATSYAVHSPASKAHTTSEFFVRGNTASQPGYGRPGYAGAPGAAPPGQSGLGRSAAPSPAGAPGAPGGSGNGINIFLVPTRGVGSCSSDTSSGMVQLPSMFSMGQNVLVGIDPFHKTRHSVMTSFL